MSQTQRQDPLIAGTEEARYLDYRYRGAEVERDRAWDKYKRWTPEGRKRLADKILMSACAQEQVFVVVDDQKIDEGFRCSKCGERNKHARWCDPPRGLTKEEQHGTEEFSRP